MPTKDSDTPAAIVTAAASSTAIAAVAWVGETAPEAIGRLRLVACARSAVTSTRSFRTYAAEAARQKATAANSAVTSEPVLNWWAVSIGTRISAFLAY